jgi:hypothetical protein
VPIGDRTDLKYLTFVELDPEGRRTKVYSIYGRGLDMLLGYIRFRPQWRCYVFHPEHHTLFDIKCLRDISEFIEAQNTAWKATL